TRAGRGQHGVECASAGSAPDPPGDICVGHRGAAGRLCRRRGANASRYPGCSLHFGASVAMSIVERAADKLRQTSPQATQRPQPVQAADGGEPSRTAFDDHIEAAGSRQSRQRQSRQEQAGPRPKLTIDFRELHRTGLVPPASAEKLVAREYQRIKRPLISNATGVNGVDVVNGNRFMVASAVSGEGKTFTSFNLALSLAKERDYSVVLIDGDVIKPSISRALGSEKAQGLTDILADATLSFSNTVFVTNVPRLTTLPSGQYPDSGT